jgi:glycosyltransferase involved in cell wall biosynthesis
MKIVVSGYVGKKITGIGRNLICVLNAASDNNEYIVYANYDMMDDFKFTNKKVKVKTYNVSKMSSIKNLLWTTFVFPIRVVQEKADRALIPNFTLLLFKYKPTVVIMHDLIEFNIPDKFSKLKMFYRTKLADPITAKRADHIITDSNNSKKDIIKFLGIPENKISVIYCGVDQKKFQKMNRDMAEKILKKKGLPIKFLLYAGTIDHPGKNAMGVIKAFEILKENKEYTGSLILAGMPGANYQIVKDYADNSKYSANIHFTGYVTDQELIALYSLCDVFIFISLYEGFGLPPLEALSCGAKVVVSNTSSLPEVVGDVGITVDPKDNKKVADSIYSYLNKIDENNTSKLKDHLSKFDWKKIGVEFSNTILNFK